MFQGKLKIMYNTKPSTQQLNGNDENIQTNLSVSNK